MDIRRIAGAVVALAAMALLAGCALAPVSPAPGGECDSALAAMDARIDAAGVRDGSAARVAGFPGLRVNRFLASFRSQPLEVAATREWVESLARLGAETAVRELANLPPESRAAVEALVAADGPAGLEQRYRACVTERAGRDAADAERLAALRDRARVPDDYDTWKRVAGFYWVTRLAFANGIDRWHGDVLDTFARPLPALSPGMARIAYAPPAPDRSDSRTLLRSSLSPALRIPEPSPESSEALFRLFAPTFVVARGSDADDPGAPGWVDGRAAIAARAPVAYRRVSHARRGDDVLLQLEYWLWFPERPKASGFDLLGGRLDAVVWRVTLTPDGEPWVYDSIHACGCYHLFFPTPRAVARPAADTLDEQGFSPQALPRIAPGMPIEVWLEAGTHYVQRVVVGDSGMPKTNYRFLELADLARAPRPDGTTRSLFRPDGIVEGTERAERWLFWPMGIREPGAMRQWGRHATAFVGRRHFDDPGLIARYFDLQ